MLRCVAPFFVLGPMQETGGLKSDGPAFSEGQARPGGAGRTVPHSRVVV